MYSNENLGVEEEAITEVAIVSNVKVELCAGGAGRYTRIVVWANTASGPAAFCPLRDGDGLIPSELKKVCLKLEKGSLIQAEGFRAVGTHYRTFLFRKLVIAQAQPRFGRPAPAKTTKLQAAA